MSRLEIPTPIRAQVVVEGLYRDLERRIESSPPGLCPVDMTRLSDRIRSCTYGLQKFIRLSRRL